MNWQRIGAAALLWFWVAAAHAADVLPSWRDGPARQALIAFVGEVTDPAGKKFVPAPERIAVFDNDGTLWAEQPMYFQVLFAFDRLRAMAPAHPEWQANPLFKAVIDNDAAAIAAAGEKGLIDIVMATHGGAHADFMAAAKAWLAQARHPQWRRPFVSLTYQPMRELLGWLRTQGFKTFIVTGGDTEFVRAFAEREYGVPPEQVIGSRLAWALEEADGRLQPARTTRLDVLNDGKAKVLSIAALIGRRPILAVDNSDGDAPMLRWTSEGDGPRLAALVHHTDAQRETAYDRESHIGRLDKGLNEAAQRGWLLIDMKRDWTEVFPALR